MARRLEHTTNTDVPPIAEAGVRRCVNPAETVQPPPSACRYGIHADQGIHSQDDRDSQRVPAGAGQAGGRQPGRPVPRGVGYPRTPGAAGRSRRVAPRVRPADRRGRHGRSGVRSGHWKSRWTSTIGPSASPNCSTRCNTSGIGPTGRPPRRREIGLRVRVVRQFSRRTCTRMLAATTQTAQNAEPIRGGKSSMGMAFW